MKKIHIALSLLLLAGLAAAPLQAREQKEQLSTKAELQKGTDQRHELHKKRAAAGGFDIMFVGDSITDNWEAKAWAKKVWQEKIAPLKAQPFGIPGNRTEHVLWRVQNGLFEGKSNPKLVVLMIGTNNTGQRADKPRDIADGVKAIIEAIRKEKPSAKILVLAIFPRDAKPTDAKRVNNEAANAIIKDFADGQKVFFANINPVFLTADGTLEKSIMPDLLHLSEEGYNRWADAVLPEIKKVLEKK